LAEPAIAVPEETREWAARSLRTRLLLMSVLAIVCLTTLVAVMWLWIDASRENDELRESGVEVEALVVDKRFNFSRRGGSSSSTSVEFTFDGTTYASRIEYSVDEQVGDRIPILVDPSDPTSIREPSRQNIHPGIWIVALAFALLTAFNAGGSRAHLRARRFLREQPFHEGGLVIDNERGRRGRRHRRLTLVAAGQRYEIIGGELGKGQPDRAAHVVYASDGRHVLVLIPGERVGAFGRVERRPSDLRGEPGLD
jgi:hypothetical protein